MHMALQKQGIARRIQAAGNVLRELGGGAAAQLLGVLPHGESVQVRHKIIAVKLVRQRGPVFHRAQIVAQMQITGGLDAREHDFFSDIFVIHTFLLLSMLFSTLLFILTK